MSHVARFFTPLQAAVLALLSGCVVLSLNPFCPKDKIVEAPELNGEWRLVSSFGEDMSAKRVQNWRIKKDVILAFDEENIGSELKASFFKTKDVLLADIAPGKSVNNAYWNLTVLPAHALVKVELKGDTLRFIPLDVEWFRKNSSGAAKNLRRSDYCAVGKDPSEMVWVDKDGGDTKPDGADDCKESIYTCPTKNWTEFLEKNVGNPEIFSEKNAVVLKRASP